jgi:glyoxylase-like metal-dependent hydrolase (beta-lactamase superfamily II)
MRKLLVSLMLVAVVAFAAPAWGGKGQDFSKVQIKVAKVSGSIYVLEGAGGNIAASIDDHGIVIVDDQFAPLADKIQASLNSLGITDKPVRFVINTHYHGDHTGGNAPFSNGLRRPFDAEACIGQPSFQCDQIHAPAPASRNRNRMRRRKQR